MARVQDAGMLVALYASDSGYQRYLNTWEGTTGEYVAFRPKTFAAVADDGRAIQDALASAICHGMLTPFPGVHLISVENGGSWVGHLVRNPIGADRVCFGSDYPHPEGLDDPVAWRAEVADLPAADVERIMSTNLKQLLAA